jgi:hypothetical protein
LATFCFGRFLVAAFVGFWHLHLWPLESMHFGIFHNPTGYGASPGFANAVEGQFDAIQIGQCHCRTNSTNPHWAEVEMGKVVGPLSWDNCGAKIACEIASNFVLSEEIFKNLFLLKHILSLNTRLEPAWRLSSLKILPFFQTRIASFPSLFVCRIP